MAKDKKNTGTSFNTKGVGVDRKTAKPHPVNKSFKEILDITYKQHRKSFKKLAEW